MSVYGYLRVSTTRQADEGESLGVQQRQVEGYAHMLGYKIDGWFIERGVSGSTKLSDRPQGGQLLGTVRKDDIIITPKLDRMFRSSLDALDMLGKLRDAGVGLHMIDLGGDVTTNGISKLVFTILSAVAEAERDRIRERVQTVKADQRQRGRYLGGRIPFGWAVGDDGELVEDDAQQTAIRKMVKLRGEGVSLRKVADAIREDYGFDLPPVTVKRIVERAFEAV